MKQLLPRWTNPCFGAHPHLPPVDILHGGIAPISSRLTGTAAAAATAAAANATIVDVRLTRALLTEARVVGQLDRKFIVLQHGGTLYAVDQHAADERVRYEMLLRRAAVEGGAVLRETANVAGDGPSTTASSPSSSSPSSSSMSPFSHIACVPLQPPEPFPRPIASRHLSRIRHYGWRVDQHRRVITHAPRVLNTALLRSATDLAEYLDALDERHGVGPTAAPPAISRLIANRACRYAIMFGDELTRDECVTLMARLRTCEMPFQCAHGRPSVVPLLANYQRSASSSVVPLLADDQHSASSSSSSLPRS